MALRGTCPKCNKRLLLTKHHIEPVCHYGKYGRVVYLCRPCHDELERYIYEREGSYKTKKRVKLKQWRYHVLYHRFIHKKED